MRLWSPVHFRLARRWVDVGVLNGVVGGAVVDVDDCGGSGGGVNSDGGHPIP